MSSGLSRVMVSVAPTGRRRNPRSAPAIATAATSHRSGPAKINSSGKRSGIHGRNGRTQSQRRHSQASEARHALKKNSAALIVVHNHPSGDPTPSPEDVLVTREIVAAGQLLDIEVLDHLVIGHGRYISLRERGLGFPKP